MINPLFYKALAGLWAATIALLSLLPSEIAVTTSVWDKLEHAAAFFVLSVLVRFCQPNWSNAIVWVLGSAYGALIEVGQLFSPGRFADPLDALANAVGAILGLGVVHIWQSTRRKPDHLDRR